MSPSITTGNVRYTAAAATRDVDVSVFDISGMRLKSTPMRAELKGGVLQGEIDLVGQPAGVYIIRVSKEGTNITAKVVITKAR